MEKIKKEIKKKEDEFEHEIEEQSGIYEAEIDQICESEIKEISKEIDEIEEKFLPTLTGEKSEKKKNKI